MMHNKENMKHILTTGFAALILAFTGSAQTLNAQDGLYYTHDGATFTGTVVEHHENGQMKSKLKVMDGLVAGKAEFFTPEGLLAETGEYRDGVKHGEWIQFGKNGVRTGQAFYKMSKKDGVWMVWDEEGKKRCQMVYANGQKVDVWLMWDENEQLVSERVYTK
jgi:antitoxin component YwqK of YwqJK toxin-antitoxin module